MPITDEEYNSLIGRLRAYIEDLIETYPETDQEDFIKGNIGEKFVGYCVCHTLWRLGYPIKFNNQPRSYKLEAKFGADENGRGGVDLKLTIVDSSERTIKFLIEIKNWDYYSNTTFLITTYNSQAVSRFPELDVGNEYHWITTMNIRNVDRIRTISEENNIHILPIMELIIPDNVIDDDVMRPVFSNFIDSFDNLMRTLAPEDSYPPVDIGDYGDRRDDYIIQDLLLGVPYSIMVNRYERSLKYIYRIAHYVNGFTPLIDRRKKDWRKIRELQE
jgi:hypothetical protein